MNENNLLLRIKKPLEIILIAVFFLMLASFLIRDIYSKDIGFHIKAGEWIVENHKVPDKDMFSYTVP